MSHLGSGVLNSGWAGGRDDRASSGSADGEGEGGGVAEYIIECEGTERESTSTRRGLLICER